MSITKQFSYNSEVAEALENNRPVLALESTIISHGMPYPQNIEFARRAEGCARALGVVPATVAIFDGKITIGLNDSQLQRLGSDKKFTKVAVRDLGPVVAAESSGATTVSATMRLAHQAGIKVFATGGIGGVHRKGESSLDISQDLRELARTPMIVVSAGVKAILDIPLTLEYLETEGVMVVAYGTDEFPAFYSVESGSASPRRIDDPMQAWKIYNTSTGLGLSSALLVANPVPRKDEISWSRINDIITSALDDCDREGIRGQAVTPYLLEKIVSLTKGDSLTANIALALNNVRLGAQIALCFNKN